MPVKLFILGLPGSGKSAIARHIEAYIKSRSWIATRFNDYSILKAMFAQDGELKRFRPAEAGGFDVLDMKVFDEAIKQLEQGVNEYVLSLKSEGQELVLIEFSRNNYEDAFDLFERDFFKDASFIYLEARSELRRQRIDKRVAHPQFLEDDHPVPEYVFGTYYNHDDGQNIARILEQYYQVDAQHVLSFDNNGSFELACRNVESFIRSIINSPSAVNK